MKSLLKLAAKSPVGSSKVSVVPRFPLVKTHLFRDHLAQRRPISHSGNQQCAFGSLVKPQSQHFAVHRAKEFFRVVDSVR